MPVDRPTFSESWYRVSTLRPRLRSTVQVHRQHYRGQTWHVVQDPGSNQFFRLNVPGYHFVGMLDGKRTVAEVWRACNEELGDSAPTQGEVIRLLGQLYTSNLLHAELPPDAEGLFNRYRKRIKREIQGYLTNLLFIRIPLIDPDHFLNWWVGVFGKLFTWYGFVAWMVLLSAGFYAIAGRFDDLTRPVSGILDPEKLPLLYISMIFVKVIHEFGHAFACKRFGRITGTGGEVHIMGVMFLVFTPLPYVDASSAWAFRKKWHRVVVGMGGMLVELGIAAVAAIVWANTREGTVVHSICYNMMFIASVSTLLFNGNPLLRYDAYYILSDLIEIPNLSHRSKGYLYYLVRRYVWGVKRAQNPAHTGGEKVWFVFYGIASTAYRFFIVARILLFIADKLFMVGLILAVVAIVAWVLVPIGKFVRYLATSGELTRVRGRAVLTTLIFFGALIGAIGLIPAPDRFRIEGVVEPVELEIVHTRENGFVSKALPSGQLVGPDCPRPLIEGYNLDLSAERDALLARRRAMAARKRLEQSKENIAAVQIYTRQVATLNKKIARVEEQLANLNLRPMQASGVWVAPNIERAEGAYLKRGQTVGMVASLDRVRIRAVAEQDVPVGEFADKAHVEIRVKGRPDDKLSGTIEKILPAGQEQLPSAALGYAVGGSIQTAQDDRRGTKSAERFFEIRVRPGNECRLRSGQRVIVRIDTPRKPLAKQWWRAILQLVQQRFQI